MPATSAQPGRPVARCAWLGLLTLGLVACAHRPIPEPTRDLRHAATAYELGYENGLRVFVAPDPTSNLAEIDLRIWAGARDEPVGKAGLAHLVEHAALELAPGGRRISSSLAATALDWNAFTGPDTTHYRALVLADDVASVVQLYGELLRGDCSSLMPELFAREQAVVGNEIRLRHDTLLLDERESLTAALYPVGHPYAHGLAGTPAGIAAVTRDDVCQFLADHYDPSRAAVVVTGAVSLEQIKTLTDAVLRPLVSRAPPARMPVPPLVGGPRKARWSRPNPAVALAFPVATRFTDQYPAVVLFTLAGEAVLDASIADNHRLIRGRVALLGGDEAPALVFVVEYTDPSARDEAVTALRSAVDGVVGVATHPVAEQRLRQIQRLATFEVVEPLTTRGFAYAEYLRAPPGYGAFQGDLNRIDGLDTTLTRNVAAHTFGGDKGMLIDLEPTPGSPTTAAAGAEVRLEISHDHGGEPGLHTPEHLLARRGASLPIQESTLSNGLRVVMAPSSLMPVVDMRLVLPVGNVDAPADEPYVPLLTAHMASPRLTTDNVRSLVSAAFAGIEVDTRVDDRSTVFSVRSLSIYSDYALGALRSAVTDSEHLQSDIDKFRTTVSKLSAQQPPVSRTWTRLVGRLVGKCVEVDAAAFDGLDARSLSRFQRQHYLPRGATLIVTGLFDPAFVLSQVEAAFAHWRTSREPAARVAHPPVLASTSDPTVAVEHIAGLRQVYLRVGFAVPASEVDAVAMALLRELVAAEVRVVRDRLGASYAPDVSVVHTCGVDMLVITGDVEATRAADVTRALVDALASLRSGHDFPKKFARARQSVVRDLVAEANDSRALADRLQYQVARDQPPDAYRQLAERAAAMSPALLAGLLTRALDPRRTAALCYGDARPAEHACQVFVRGKQG